MAELSIFGQNIEALQVLIDTRQEKFNKPWYVDYFDWDTPQIGLDYTRSTEETIDWIETEEKGKRLAIGKGDGETTLSFEVANPSLETQAYYLGGTVKNEGGKKSYSPPKNKPVVEKSFKLVTKQGFDIEIPNGKVTATPLSGQVGTDSVMTMKIKISVQEPEKAGVDWIRYCEK